jgi:hypothetical protein
MKHKAADDASGFVLYKQIILIINQTFEPFYTRFVKSKDL